MTAPLELTDRLAWTQLIGSVWTPAGTSTGTHIMMIVILDTSGVLRVAVGLLPSWTSC